MRWWQTKAARRRNLRLRWHDKVDQAALEVAWFYSAQRSVERFYLYRAMRDYEFYQTLLDSLAELS